MDVAKIKALLFSKPGYVAVIVFIAAVAVLSLRVPASPNSKGTHMRDHVLTSLGISVAAYLATAFSISSGAHPTRQINEIFDTNPAVF
jgi:NADH:ubiquinone oxidoreductase subunit 6 (subunit J)